MSDNRMRVPLLLVLGLLGLATTASAQEISTPDAEKLARATPIADSVERFTRNPTFRLAVIEQAPPDLVIPWWADRYKTPAPRPVGGTTFHQEYLRSVTPEAFRTSTIPMGIGVDPGEIINGIKSAYSGWQEERAKRRIAQELADFLAAREAALEAARAAEQR